MTEIIPAAQYKKKTTSEHSLQAQVLDYLAQNARLDVFAIAIPNAARRSPRMGARMKHEGLMPGCADLCILLQAGKVAWLEMKIAKGRQSVEQRGFEARCLRLNHPYAVAKSFEQASTFLKEIGALK